MSHEYVWLLIFFSLAGIIAVDPNVGKYIILMVDLIKVNVERYFFILRFHPRYLSSPLYKWLSMRKYMKIAKQIHEQNKSKE
jgi:hypothetical protein